MRRRLWLRIRNVIEAGSRPGTVTAGPSPRRKALTSWMGRSWELSFPQLAASAAVIVLVVALSTVVGVQRWQSW